MLSACQQQLHALMLEQSRMEAAAAVGCSVWQH